MRCITVNPRDDLQAYIEEQFPLTGEYAYLNSAVRGLVPAATIDAMSDYWRRAAHPHGLGLEEKPKQIDARARAARLLGVARGEVDFVSSTTHGLAVAATSLPLGPGDEVLIPEMEFPSVVYPFLNEAQRRGFTVRLLGWEGCGPDLDLIESAMTEHTRALCLSWVQYQNGYTHDLETLGKLCRDRNVFLVVDAIQGLGAVPLDLGRVHVDVLTAGTFKWLMSGTGLALLYVRSGLVQELTPGFAGYTGVAREVEDPDYRLQFRDDIERFNLGSANEPGMTALYHSLGLIEEVGIGTIYAGARHLADLVHDGARDKGYTVNSRENEIAPIVALTTGCRERDAELLDRLEAERVCTCIRRMGIRIAPHFYCSEDDVQRLLALL